MKKFMKKINKWWKNLTPKTQKFLKDNFKYLIIGIAMSIGVAKYIEYSPHVAATFEPWMALPVIGMFMLLANLALPLADDPLIKQQMQELSIKNFFNEGE